MYCGGDPVERNQLQLQKSGMRPRFLVLLSESDQDVILSVQGPAFSRITQIFGGAFAPSAVAVCVCASVAAVTSQVWLWRSRGWQVSRTWCGRRHLCVLAYS